MEYNENKLYPTLPSAPEDEGDLYRLQKINQIQKHLEEEMETRKDISKKYHRAVKIITNVDATLVTAGMGLGAAGIGLLSTVIAAPIVIAMEASALVFGLLGVLGTQMNKRLMKKAEKHEKIRMLAEAKLSTISDLVSKALTDKKVTDVEFALILAELTKYRHLKEETRSRTKQAIDEETKNSLIKQGREEAMNSVKRLFDKPEGQNNVKNNDKN